MIRQNKVRQVKAGLAVSVAILLATAALVWASYWKNRQSSGYVGRTGYVMMRLQEFYSTFNESEYSQALYFNTGNVHEWEKSTEERQQLVDMTHEIQALVSDFPLQEKNAKELEQLLRKRFAITRMHEGTEGPEDFMVRGPAVEDIRRKAIDMMRIENTFMQDRQEMLRVSADRSTYAVVLALAMAVILILVAFVIAMREYNERASIERQLLVSQQKLKEQVERLDESNKELEQFAYVASHDLQEPLRKIVTFSDRIHEKYQDIISPDVNTYLERISAAATRMRVLIEDLLKYSRVSKNEAVRSLVNLESVISDIKDNCEVLIQSRGVVFRHYSKLPYVFGDKTLLTQLFQNLVSNAIKFTSPETHPLIEISCTTVTPQQALVSIPESRYESYYQLTIKDNGIGFDEKFLDKIFITFYRLHGRSEYEGTGIGLSICKKIVERHEGFITARSEKGKGSVFFVYLPKDPAAPELTTEVYEHRQAG